MSRPTRHSPEVRGRRGGVNGDAREQMKALGHELHRAGAILRKASAFFARAEIDRRSET